MFDKPTLHALNRILALDLPLRKDIATKIADSCQPDPFTDGLPVGDTARMEVYPDGDHVVLHIGHGHRVFLCDPVKAAEFAQGILETAEKVYRGASRRTHANHQVESPPKGNTRVR